MKSEEGEMDFKRKKPSDIYIGRMKEGEMDTNDGQTMSMEKIWRENADLKKRMGDAKHVYSKLEELRAEHKETKQENSDLKKRVEVLMKVEQVAIFHVTKKLQAEEKLKSAEADITFLRKRMEELITHNQNYLQEIEDYRIRAEQAEAIINARLCKKHQTASGLYGYEEGEPITPAGGGCAVCIGERIEKRLEQAEADLATMLKRIETQESNWEKEKEDWKQEWNKTDMLREKAERRMGELEKAMYMHLSKLPQSGYE
jgi:hypothetical protein